MSAKGFDNGGGNYVYIRHNNGYVSAYFHLSPFASGLVVRQVKERGEFIGNVGNTGGSRGNHLHFEMRRNGALVDLTPAYSCGQKVTQGQDIPFNFSSILMRRSSYDVWRRGRRADHGLGLCHKCPHLWGRPGYLPGTERGARRMARPAAHGSQCRGYGTRTTRLALHHRYAEAGSGRSDPVAQSRPPQSLV